MISVLVLTSALHAAVAPQTGTSKIELGMASCGDEGESSLRLVDRRNEWFEVIEHYDEPVRVVKFSSRRKSDGCSEGPSEATVDLQVTTYPRDGSAPSVGKSLRIDGEDPKVVDPLSWALLRITQYGCCGAHDGYSWVDPATGKMIAVSSTEPLPLQVINRESPQGSVWRFAFGLGSVSVAASTYDASSTAVAELSFLGLDRGAQRYAIHFKPTGEDEQGVWWFNAMRWTGAGLEAGNEQTWWVDGEPPTGKQVDGMALEVELQCQCAAPPLKLSIPVRGDKLDVAGMTGNESATLKVL